jgi:hypothetical protein
MLDHPETEERTPIAAPGRLVLPALPDTPGALRSSRLSADQFKSQLAPAHLIHPKEPPAPKPLLPKLLYYWRKDSAYKVFIIAVAMIVLASIVFVSMASASWLGKPLFGGSYSPNPPGAVVPAGTVDLKPGFPKPGGGEGSGQSSQPPAQSTPVLSSTPSSGDGSPTPQPSSTPGQGGSLVVQITGYTSVVPNGSRTVITVSTNEPGVSVLLYMRSNATPRTSTAGPQVTGANGNATIAWLAYYSALGHRTVTVSMVAVATDQNGQRSTSAPVTIQVLMQGLP